MKNILELPDRKYWYGRWTKCQITHPTDENGVVKSEEKLNRKAQIQNSLSKVYGNRDIGRFEEEGN